MIRSCGATRPALRDAGWECTGSGLVVVMTMTEGGQRLPVVLPARALEIIDPEPWWDDPIVPFAGGDHVHLCVPRRPQPPFPTDSTLVFGDTAMRFRHVGTVADSGMDFGSSVTLGPGELFIGTPVEDV